MNSASLFCLVLIKVIFKFFASARVAEFAKRFCLNLADAFTSYIKLFADLFERS